MKYTPGFKNTGIIELIFFIVESDERVGKHICISFGIWIPGYCYL
jgi:hypothetical protein